MTYHLLNEFSGSTLFPTRRWLNQEDFHSLCEKAYLTIVALRLLAGCPSTQKWAHDYIARTLQATHFKHWRTTGTDLYVLLWALTSGEFEGVDEADLIAEQPFIRWLKALKRNPADTTETVRLFLRLDSMLRNHDSSLKAVRRLVQDWPDLSRSDQRLATTRLIQMVRSRAYRSDMLRELKLAANAHSLEMKHVCDLETGDGCEVTTHRHDPPKKAGTSIGFLAGLASIAGGFAASRAIRKMTETATAGATTAASVATAGTNLGGDHPGIDSNGHKGIYDKRKPKSTAIIRRPPIA
jgi:hypothetical protein